MENSALLRVQNLIDLIDQTIEAHAKVYKTRCAEYFDQVNTNAGSLTFETLHRMNELYFDDPSFYANPDKVMDPNIIDQFDKRCDGDLKVGDIAPNCLVYQFNPKDDISNFDNFDKKADIKSNPDCHWTENFSTLDSYFDSQGKRPCVVDFGSYS